MNKNIKLIIFDMDGTLYPNCEEFNKTYPEVALDFVIKKRNLSMEEAKIEFNNNIDKLSAEIGGRATNTLTLLKYYDVSFDEFENRVNEIIEIEKLLKYDEKTVKTIEKFYKKFPIVLYTTNVDKCTDRIIKHLKLEEFFPKENRFTISTMGRLDMPKNEQLKYIKPGKNGFKLILNKYNVKPEEVLMVGDSLVSDITPAKKLGINTYKIDSPQSLYDLVEYLEE